MSWLPDAGFRWPALVVALGLLAAACSAGGDLGPRASGATGASEAEKDGEGIRPLVDPEDLIRGGPPPDGIPPIDDPRFIGPGDADWLADREPVLAVEIDGDARAYPLQIMTWHEIVNDVIGGVPIAVTYCPLCNTGIAFERPTIGGRLLDFGTSGMLYRSNLVMYDRQTETYWAQATGQAIIGELVGEQLTFVPARVLSFGDWRAAYPQGKVLSRDTGHERPYGTNPYEFYDSSDQPFLFTGELDERLPATERVIGVKTASDTVAFPYSELRDRAVGGWAAVSTSVGDAPIAVFWKAGTASALDAGRIADARDVGAAVAYVPTLDGRTLTFVATGEGIRDEQTGSTWDITGHAVAGELAGEELVPAIAIESFWFDWAAFHPDTRIFGRP